MHLTEIGEIVVYEWLNTPVIRPDMNIALDEFVLMPNHFHGIIIIGNNGFNNRLINVDNNQYSGRDAKPGISQSNISPSGINTMPNGINTMPSGIKTAPSGIETKSNGIETTYTGIRDAMLCVSTSTHINPKNQFGPQAKNLSSIIRGFKSAVTINARKINPYFAWQPRFHEHIIRDYGSYQKIQNYIIDNPKKWELDDYWK